MRTHIENRTNMFVYTPLLHSSKSSSERQLIVSSFHLSMLIYDAKGQSEADRRENYIV